MAPPAQTITVALDISKAFHKINIQILIRKLIANYIKAYTTCRHHTSSQRQFKPGVPQNGILSPTLFNIYTADIPPPVQAMSTQMTSPSHLHTQAHVQPRNTYNHTYIKFLPGQNKASHTKSRQNNLHYVHSRPCRI